MERSAADATGRLVAGDVLHTRFSTLPASARVREIREWFAASTHRRMAFLADGTRYAGSLTREDVGDGVDNERAAVELVRPVPTVTPDAPVQAAYDAAVATDARRVAVVDADHTLLGVVAVTEDLARFCGTGVSTPGSG
jgi:CBS domain-containing protein